MHHVEPVETQLMALCIDLVVLGAVLSLNS
jgi:hypothetical protein